MIVYSLVNQKGGVSKTTTAAELWAGLNLLGKKALAIDLDSQGNFTYFVSRGTCAASSVSHVPSYLHLSIIRP